MIVTVVTPTWNAFRYLSECIASVEANRSPDFEIDHVLVDAGSSDGTVEFARSRGLRILQGKDDGIFDAINKGTFSSRGELVGFLGADDVMLPGGLDAVVKGFRSRQRSWAVGRIRWIDSSGVDLGRFAAPPRWLTAQAQVCLGWNPIMHIATYMRREFFESLGGFRKEFRHSADFELFARALAREPFTRIPYDVACFRRTGANNSVVHSNEAARENSAILESFGPSSALERRLWRYVLKGWFNGMNPGWSLRKARDAALYRLAISEQRHF